MDNNTQQAPLPKVEPKGHDFGGRWVPLGGKQYKLAPLSFGALRALGEKIKKLASVPTGQIPGSEELDVVGELAHRAFKRHYPETSREDFEEMLDTDNMMEVLDAVMSSAGLKKGGGEEEALGKSATP